MSSPTPYKASVPDFKLKTLHAKLELAEFPDELDAAEWDYGAPLAEVKRLTAYWKDSFDWRKQEKEINDLPNFQTEIQVDGFDLLNIHFVHQKSSVSNAIPLLFVHGCTSSHLLSSMDPADLPSGPGNFLEVVKLLPLLGKSENGASAFHVVAPSLPNFGFSDGVKKRGFALPQYAETFNKLMLKLGYEEYGMPYSLQHSLPS